MSNLALVLAGADDTDVAVAERIAAKFPTSAIAVFAVPCGWEDLEPGGATLVLSLIHISEPTRPY